ncbi:hypothetical protein D3C73_1506490 [compost metagenome]
MNLLSLNLSKHQLADQQLRELLLLPLHFEPEPGLIGQDAFNPLRDGTELILLPVLALSVVQQGTVDFADGAVHFPGPYKGNQHGSCQNPDTDQDGG